jgi:hypothetical protein
MAARLSAEVAGPSVRIAIALPEGVTQAIEGRPRGKVRREDACVGRVEAHVQERRAQQEQEREGRNEDRHGPAHHPPRESCPGSLGRWLRTDLADRESVEAAAEDRQQGRQQRQRGRDGEGDDDRPRDSDRAQDHELEQHEPEQAEQDREAAEEHGAPGGRHGDAHRGGDAIRFELRLFGELLAEPAREQERVVDAQAKPQQGRQVEHEDAHRRELGDDEDRRHRDQDARPADHERHARRDQRSEDDQQRQGREGQRDDLASLEVALADVLHVTVERRPAGELDSQARRVTQALTEDRQGVGRVVRGQVEQHDVVCRVAVGRDLARLEQVRHDADHVRSRWDVAHRRSGRGLELGAAGRERVGVERHHQGGRRRPQFLLQEGFGTG